MRSNNAGLYALITMSVMFWILVIIAYFRFHDTPKKIDVTPPPVSVTAVSPIKIAPAPAKPVPTIQNHPPIHILPAIYPPLDQIHGKG